MQTLSHGVKKPETGDKGSVWFPAMEDNCDILNDHNHDGSNSAAISSQSISVVIQSILAAAWSAVSGGTYEQTITVPNSKLFDNSYVVFKNASTGAPMFLNTAKQTASTYKVYINDPSVSLVAYYLT